MTEQERFVGKSILASPFAGDQGEADHQLLTSLIAHRAGTVDAYSVAARLQRARVFVPVMAVLDEAEQDSATGRQVEKDSHMAVVSVQDAAGRKAALAFSSVAVLATWSRDARPVAATASAVAAATLADGVDFLILDLRAEHSFVLEQGGLIALAEGRVWVRPLDDAEVVQAVESVLAPIGISNRCRFEIRSAEGPADLRIVVIPDEPESVAADLSVVLDQAAIGLGANELLRARLIKGVELGILH